MDPAVSRWVGSCAERVLGLLAGALALASVACPLQEAPLLAVAAESVEDGGRNSDADPGGDADGDADADADGDADADADGDADADADGDADGDADADADLPCDDGWGDCNGDAADGCDAVIHLVGIIQPGPGYSFKSIHVDGTNNTVEAAKAAGTVKHFVYQSALGTRPDAVAEHHRTKYQAEEITKASGIPYTITRPSIIFGKGDGFTTRMTEVIRGAPVVPILGDGKGLVLPSGTTRN